MSISTPDTSDTPHAEQFPPNEHTPRQLWYDQFIAVASTSEMAPDAITESTRPDFAHFTLAYVSDHVRITDKNSVHLPHDLISHRLDEYYKKFPPTLSTEKPDAVQQLFFDKYRRANLNFTHSYRRRFRELRIATRLEEDLRSDSYDKAADAVLDLMVSYGMGLRALQTISNNVHHVLK